MDQHLLLVVTSFPSSIMRMPFQDLLGGVIVGFHIGWSTQFHLYQAISIGVYSFSVLPQSFKKVPPPLSQIDVKF